MGGYFGSADFHSFPRYARCPFLLTSQFLRWRASAFFSLIVFCFLCFHEDGKQTMVMLVVNNLWFSSVLFFLQGRRQWQGWSVTLLYLSLLLCIYIFLGLCSVSFLLWFALFLGSVFVLDSVYFFFYCVLCAMFFSGLIALFFWVFPSFWFCQLLGIYRDQSSSPSASRLSSW